MESTRISDAFQVFMKEAPAYQEAWLDAVKKVGAASAAGPEN